MPPAPRAQAAPGAAVPAADIEDLNDQLQLLREQLEVAFDDVEARIAAADARAVAAEAAAAAANTRAEVASAQAANVLYAVDDLVAEVALAIEQGRPTDVHRVRTAADQLRKRLQAS